MDVNAIEELPALIADFWARLQGLRQHDAPLFALVVVGLVFVEGLALGALLDLILPRHRPSPGRRE